MPKIEYDRLVDRFRRLVEEIAPPKTTVVVVSRGDAALLELRDRDAWHFPRRSDGAYAGYHPRDSAAAVTHLESLRKKGADVLAFPWVSLWWLEHYDGFREHLEEHYREIVWEEDTAVVFALSDAVDGRARRGNGRGKRNVSAVGASRKPRTRAQRTRLLGHVGAKYVEPLRALFDKSFYSQRTKRRFKYTDDALLHYLDTRGARDLDPHPLFSSGWYRRRYAIPDDTNPLVHFVTTGAADGNDPNPYFDTAYYWDRHPSARDENPLVHYIENASAGHSGHPNPLFVDDYYLKTYRDAHASRTPLEHFLQFGCDDGNFGSPVNRNIVTNAQHAGRALSRGEWHKGTILFFTVGGTDISAPVAIADVLARKHRVGTLVVALRPPAWDASAVEHPPPLILEDYELATEIFRPSALRFLTLTLTARRPLLAVSEVAETLEPLMARAVPTYFLAGSDGATPAAEQLRAASVRPGRILVRSPSDLDGAHRALEMPKNRITSLTSTRPASRATGARDAARTIVDLAAKDFGLRFAPRRRRRRAPTKSRKVIVPCSDWAVSGVNAALEALGVELTRRGWDLEIVFTRNEDWAFGVPDADKHLPRVPYRFLEREKPGLVGMWEALIGEIEQQAPCILLLTYDFMANGVAPALTEGVGIVSWVQADDADYYEQVYRLGRYCNEVVCVSKRINERIAALNPAIADRARVIHNSSVFRGEISQARGPRSSKMRLIYTGRLVQYQKRILDVIDVAQALDKTGVAYELSLLGTFSRHEDTETRFRERAAAHLEDGRITLWGRRSKEEILDALATHDFFVLLSDFEGLPLSLVEAMARGCVPVVAASESGIPELIESGHNGVIVPSRDYAHWASALTSLWADKGRLALMSRRARATVRRGFTVERVADQFERLFQEVLTELESGRYERPAALHTGSRRAQSGDVLPPPDLLRPAALQMPGLP